MHQNRTNLVLLIVAAVAPVMSEIVSYSTGHGHWFGRSGSITVLLAAVIQYRLAAQLANSQHGALVTGVMAGFPRRASLTSLGRFLAVSSLLLIIIGTAIWGYGDLMFDTPP